MESPWAELLVGSGSRGLKLVHFLRRPDDLERVLAGRPWREDPSPNREVMIQLRSYFRAQLKEFTCRLDPEGTPFQTRVWKLLLEIPFGETRSYGQLAFQLGQPRAARAVGNAVHGNPIALLIPCHRVVGSRGELTGYAGGLDLKAHLLEHEKSIVNGQSSMVNCS
ncbi:MAG: methylated-DNA--[protein]-cysteine S-methyltransferase [Acidobacteria bacterium]|nr:methylated-DNA--[protein]-cysteine S-methyltransferase [Acidobacteriota bacterium]